MRTPATVEEYLGWQPEAARAKLEEMRAAIRAVVPDATETISYQMPGFRYRGRVLVTYAAFRDHVSLFPMGGGVIDAMRDELAPHIGGKGTLHFALDAPLPVDLIQRVVRAKLQESTDRGR